MHHNEVFINDQDIIEVMVRGDQTIASIEDLSADTLELAASQKAAGKRVAILDNLLGMGAVPPEGRKLVVDLIKSNEYDKLAMLGADNLVRFGANLMLQATGKSQQAKYFDDR
jgi:hypothetical protein